MTTQADQEFADTLARVQEDIDRDGAAHEALEAYADGLERQLTDFERRVAAQADYIAELAAALAGNNKTISSLTGLLNDANTARAMLTSQLEAHEKAHEAQGD